MKKIAILGASGSIGTQTIDVIKNNPDKFELVSASVGSNIDYLNNLIATFPTLKAISVQNEADLGKVNEFNGELSYGIDGMSNVATIKEADVVITAVVGSVGLLPTIAAIKAKKNIGLANKETLVTAGHIIMPLIKEYDVKLYPVDSEHSAIFQCLNGENSQEINKLIITASGGSFRDQSRDELKNVSVADALNHPNWSMGAKITIDSATMFNKGLEVIEAHHLFGIDYEDIEVLIHKQSIIHSMVEFADFSVMAQLGTPDMRLPIQYAITYPERLEIKNSKRLSLAKISQLDFKDVDYARYPAVRLAYMAGKAGGSMPTVLNAANEVAVALFLAEKIKFLEIETIVSEAMKNHILIENPTVEQILDVDQNVRKIIQARYN